MTESKVASWRFT